MYLAKYKRAPSPAEPFLLAPKDQGVLCRLKYITAPMPDYNDHVARRHKRAEHADLL